MKFMKKLLLFALIALAGLSFAEDQTFTIAAGSTTATITNSTIGQRWYLKSVYAKQAAAAADTVSLVKMVGSTAVVIKSQTMTTNASDVNINLVVPSTVYLTYGESCRIVRADTNNAIVGFVVTDKE
jgi:hypothetical protein